MNYFFKILFLSLVLFSCTEDGELTNEERRLQTYDGSEGAIVQFSTETTLIETEGNGDVTVDIPITSSEISDLDRTFPVTVNQLNTTATPNQYSFSGSAVIPAGAYEGSLIVTGVDAELAVEPVVLELELDEGTSYVALNSLHTVTLQAACTAETGYESFFGPVNVEVVTSGTLPGTAFADPLGSCDVVIIDSNLPNAGAATANGGPYAVLLSPDAPGSTAGTATVEPTLSCTSCSDGLDGFYSASGTYDELTGTITLFYNFERSDGASFSTGINIITTL